MFQETWAIPKSEASPVAEVYNEQIWGLGNEFYYFLASIRSSDIKRWQFFEHQFVFLLSYYIETEIISPGDHSCLQHDFIFGIRSFIEPPSDIWSNRLVRLWKKSSAIIWYTWMKKFSDMHVGSIPSGCGSLVGNFNFFSGKPNFSELYEVFL